MGRPQPRVTRLVYQECSLDRSIPSDRLDPGWAQGQVPTMLAKLDLIRYYIKL